MYACMHVCMHVRMYVCMYACMHVCMCIHKFHKTHGICESVVQKMTEHTQYQKPYTHICILEASWLVSIISETSWHSTCYRFCL